MKHLFIIAALFITSLVNATEQNHYFTPNRNIIMHGKTTVYFVAQNPEKYDWVKWDFGDGQMEYAINPAHEYTKIGIYDVKMIVSKGPRIDTFCKKAFVTILPSKNNTVGGDANVNFDYSKDVCAISKNEKGIAISADLDNNFIQIMNNENNNGELEIRYLNGDVLFQTALNSNETLKNIDINILNKGLYLVCLTMNNQTTVQKFYKN